MTLEVTIVYKHGFLIEFAVYLFIKKFFLPLVGELFFVFQKKKKKLYTRKHIDYPSHMDVSMYPKNRGTNFARKGPAGAEVQR